MYTVKCIQSGTTKRTPSEYYLSPRATLAGKTEGWTRDASREGIGPAKSDCYSSQLPGWPFTFSTDWVIHIPWATLKKSLFPVQRMAEIVASRAAATGNNFFFSKGGLMFSRFFFFPPIFSKSLLYTNTGEKR